MRPRRISVFDGLRVSLEHVDHLQDSAQSAIEELREAAGLGRIVRPFEVREDGDGQIVVGPGLAFDRRRRRLAIDEPQRAAASLPEGRDTQYVCLEHREVTDLEVEGRPTLIFDSVAVVLRDSLPGAGDDPLAIARLRRSADGGGFDVAPLGEPDVAPATVPVLRIRQGVLELPGAGATVQLGFAPAGVTCTVKLRAAPAGGEAVESLSHGEATFAGDSSSSFGFVTTAGTTELIQDAVAGLALGADGPRLRVTLAAAPGGFAVTCSAAAGLTWNATVGWKAVGT